MNPSNNQPAGPNGPDGPDGSDDGGDDGKRMRKRLDNFQVMETGMASFRQIMRSEKCMERVSCRMAGAKNPSLTLIWMNW